MEPTKLQIPDLTEDLAIDLARFARRPVQVIVCGSGFAEQKFGDAPNSQTIKIEMNPEALQAVRKADQKETVWRAIGFYRLVHQLNDASRQSDLAKQAGFAEVFRVLNDEHNQRKLAAVNPPLGAALQTLASHVYRSKTPTAGLMIDTAGSGAEYKGQDEYLRRLGEFTYRLRRHLQPAKNTTAFVVVEALNLVPENLKDFSKDMVLDLASTVQTVLTRGLELPKVTAKAPEKAASVAAADTNSEFEFTDEDVEEGELELADIVSPTDPRWWQLLFKSKWSYIVLGSFVMGWLSWLMKAGLGFWTAIAYTVIFAAVCLGAVGLIALFSHKSERSPSTWTWKSLFAKIFSLSWMPFRIHWQWNWSSGFSWSSLFPFRIQFRLDNLKKLLGLPGILAKGFYKHVVEPTVDFIVSCAKSFKTRVTEVCFAVRNFCEDVIKSKASQYFFGGICRGATAFGAWTQRLFVLLWRHSTFRLFLLALPIAILVAITWAMGSIGAELVLWQFVVVGVFWLLLIGLGYIYSPKLFNWVIADVYTDHEDTGGHVAISLPLDKTTTTFEQINNFKPVNADPSVLNSMKEKILAVAQPLKDSLRRCGLITASKDNMSEGFDLIDEIELIQYTGETEIFVDEIEKPRVLMIVDVVVDCSTSGNEETAKLKKGEKFRRGQLFALAIEEAIRGKRGVTGRFWGYDDGTIYECGTAGDNRVSGLSISSGGNNDAAALFHVTQNAGSDKSKRVVVMIGDSQQADCSWGALNTLGFSLIQRDVTVVQVLTEPCADPALPWHLVDLHDQSLANASAFLGRILEGQIARR